MILKFFYNSLQFPHFILKILNGCMLVSQCGLDGLEKGVIWLKMGINKLTKFGKQLF